MMKEMTERRHGEQDGEQDENRINPGPIQQPINHATWRKNW